ncbi:MAG: transcription-repair coupling factor, partial [Acidimicrobiia bacterium]
MPAPLAPLVDRWRTTRFPTPPGRWVVPSGARAFALAGLAAARAGDSGAGTEGRAAGPVLAVVPGEREAEELYDDLSLFTDDALLLPAWETLPFEHISPNAATMAARARARHLLGEGKPGTVAVASVRAVTQRLSPSAPDPVVLGPGDELAPDRLAGALAGLGYHRVERVESRGEFAVRGGIVDVFPAQAHEPVRLDYWGDLVEEARAFSVVTQRSLDPAGRLVAYPARELRPDPTVRARAGELLVRERWAAATWDRLAEGMMFQGMESWLPWLAEERTVIEELPSNGVVVLVEPIRAGDRSRELVKEEAELAAALATTWGHGAPEAGDHPALYLDLDRALGSLDILELPALAAGPGDDALDVRGLDATPGDSQSVAGGLTRWLAAGVELVVAMDGEPAADRVARVLAEEGLALP